LKALCSPLFKLKKLLGNTFKMREKAAQAKEARENPY
jgi:hypothetical protein